MGYNELYEKYGGKPPKKTSKKNDKKLLMILILIIAIGVVIVIVLILLFPSGSGQTLELKSGFRYEYPMITAYSSTVIEVYGTEETGNSWKGIITIRDDVNMLIFLCF